MNDYYERGGEARGLTPADWSGLPTLGRAWERRRLNQVGLAQKELWGLYGIRTYGPNKYGSLVVSTSDFEALQLISRATHWDNAELAHFHTILAGVPLEIAPDWTCDELAVARARIWAYYRVWFERPVERLVRRVLRWFPW